MLDPIASVLADPDEATGLSGLAELLDETTAGIPKYSRIRE